MAPDPANSGWRQGSLAGMDEVTYTSFKPQHAWRGTAAEQVLDLDHSETEREFFVGTAREAALP